ncbi:SEC-C motif-containing protein [Kribbella sp. VKM Ac-2527]|uniref:SEC-C motif-containing protein n=2 Tax=Kribbella caucasensis TaxID=2512215 RepID=A0A4R6J3S9_9ACTN|nr:SEC-C motif-containing protein [Kribbella sp. VKM Ac-2527]
MNAHIRGLEAELEEYPDQRGEILLEMAASRLEMGERDRAVAIWRDLIAEGGDDGDYARIDLVEYLFGIGQEEDARAELAALKATHRTSGAGWELAAELLEERGELTEALVWYTMATERFTTADIAILGEDAGWASLPGVLVRRRRELRSGMGLAPDETDQLVPAEEDIQDLFRRPFPSVEEAAEAMRAHRGVSAEVRMLFWPRSEFDTARERWPDAIDQDLSQAEYYRDLEAKLDTMASEGAGRVNAVHCSVESFAVYVDTAGERPLDSSAARRDYLDARYSEGHHLQWPPPRNQPCWCGSGAKYKKCCGAPTH